MKLFKSLAIGAAVACSSVSAQAKDINLKQVAADAGWVFHVNSEKFENSQIGDYILNTYLPEREQLGLTGIRAALGQEIVNNIHGITAYGGSADVTGAVFLLNAVYDKDEMYAHASQNEDFETKAYKNHELVKYPKGITNKKLKKISTHPWVCYYSNEMLLVAGSLDDLMNGIDVLEGDNHNLADNGESSLKNKLKDKTIVVAALDMNSKFLKRRPRAVTFQEVDRVFVTGDEVNNSLSFDLLLESRTSAAAQQIKAIVDGFKSYTVVALQSQPSERTDKMSELFNAIKVTQNDSKVLVNMSFSIEDITHYLDKTNFGL